MSKLTVRTDIGVFSRRTARSYTHLVAVKGMRAEYLEARRQSELKETERLIAAYREGKDGYGGTLAGVAEEKVARWIAEYEQTLAKLRAEGPITSDRGEWAVLGWCGRADLAAKLAATEQASHYRHVRIYEVASGECVRSAR